VIKEPILPKLKCSTKSIKREYSAYSIVLFNLQCNDIFGGK